MSYDICWSVKYRKTHNFDWVLKCFVHLTICHIIRPTKTKTVTNEKILVLLSVKKEKKNPQALPCSCVTNCVEHTEFFPMWIFLNHFSDVTPGYYMRSTGQSFPPVLKIGEHWLWGQEVSCLQLLMSCSLVVKSCQLFSSHGLQSTRLLCPWDFSGKNTEVGCHFLCQGLNPWLLHRQVDALPLSHQESQGNSPNCLNTHPFTA